MANSQKYSIQIKQDRSSWSAKIMRRVSSQKTVVSKRQGGFDSEAEAQSWGDAEMVSFLDNLNARNKRRSKPRTES